MIFVAIFSGAIILNPSASRNSSIVFKIELSAKPFFTTFANNIAPLKSSNNLEILALLTFSS